MVSHNNDNLQIGKCCYYIKRVEDYEKKFYNPLTDLPEKEDGFCFKIIQKLYDWELCHRDEEIISEFRERLIGSVIAKELNDQGIYDVKPFLMGSKCPVP